MSGPSAAPSNAWTRLKVGWGVTDWGVITILVAFAITGFIVLRISRPIVDAILPDDVPGWLWWTVKIIVIVPIYEILLVSIRTLLGQGRFFRDKQRRLLRLIARPFRKR